MEKTYVAIDLKSFYASVECADRGRDPLTTNLVVADPTRTEKTICLAVSPSLKSYGIPGRPRLFEVVQQVKKVNEERKRQAPEQAFSGKSDDNTQVEKDPSLELSYIVAPPRMARYMEMSNRIHEIYLKYISPEDIHVYSCDELFMDVTPYLETYQMSAQELTATMIREVKQETQITATAGIGSNLYLCKIAMDVVAKHMPADENGARIASLTEESYRRLLWGHTPITDFWRVGPGTARRLQKLGLSTMGDVARFSETGEDILYQQFGINAELLIDHAWGWEPCTIADIHAYRPEDNSISTGQVLMRPYRTDEAGIVIREMTEGLALDLVEKMLVTDQLVLTVGYDTESLADPEIRKKYHGEIVTDRYGRQIPSHAHGTVNLDLRTSAAPLLVDAVMGLYERIINPDLLVRRITVAACKVLREDDILVREEASCVQMNLFTDFGLMEDTTKSGAEKGTQNGSGKGAKNPGSGERSGTAETLQKAPDRTKDLERFKALQKAELEIKKRYGKNAILKGTDFLEGATARERNAQIGGHKA